ncbi:hypothetical protein Tco_1072680 [Tanacetum coccineum]
MGPLKRFCGLKLKGSNLDSCLLQLVSHWARKVSGAIPYGVSEDEHGDVVTTERSGCVVNDINESHMLLEDQGNVRGAGVEVQIARIFNTYGPRMCIDDGRVVSNFVAHALRKVTMTVTSDGGGSNAVDGSEAKMEQASQCGQVQVFLL